MARQSFVNGPALDATRCSGSADTAIADNAIAVPLAAPKPGAGSAAAPAAGVPSGPSVAPKDGSIIATASANTASAGGRDGSGFPIDLFSGKIRLWDIGIRPGNGSSPPACGFRAVPASGAACTVPALRRLWPEQPFRRSFPAKTALWKREQMISPETHVQIRRCFYAEHWKIGTIARELNVHPDAVRNAIESDRFNRSQSLRPCITDPYMEFVRQTLSQHPRLRATRIYQMIHERGYTGSVIQLRRAVALLRPPVPEPFLRLQMLPAEQAQVDWAHFGEVAVGRAP